MLDLHVHLPMYLRPPGVAARVRHSAITGAGRRSGNFLTDGAPRVSIGGLRRGGVEVALSVLHAPFDEIAPGPRDLPRAGRVLRPWGTILRHGRAPHPGAALSVALGTLVAARPPNPGAYARLLRQLDAVERHVERHHAHEAAFARSPGDLDRIRDGGRVALVHAVEGAFHLPRDPGAVAPAVDELARRGVAYLTVAHLADRGIATVAPAVPYLPDAMFHRLFPQPARGLSPLGRAVVAAAVRAGVLVDVCHMSERSLHETFALLDELDPDRSVPVIASHVGYRLGGQSYNLPEWAIREIAARGGVAGLIAATHQLADGVPEPATFDAAMDLLFRHVDAVGAAAGGHEHTAIGTDLGGFIVPLPGLDDVACLDAVREALTGRYGERDAAAICMGNAERALRAGWRRSAPVRERAA